MRCRICSDDKLSPVLDLGDQPRGNHFLKEEECGSEPHYPLHLAYCHTCKAAQLDYTVPKEVMFADHTYLSGMTQTLQNHFASIAKDVDMRFFSDKREKSVLDIGSNDGTLLKCFQELGYEVQGVEASAPIAKIANESHIPTLNAFYNEETADKMQKSFDVINASGVFFHLEELHSVTRAIKKQLKKHGVFIIQFIYMKALMDHGAFDQIYHEHLLYYTLETLNHLLRLHNLELFDAKPSDIHGGSMIAYATHRENCRPTDRLKELFEDEQKSGCNTLERYFDFARDVQKTKEHILDFLHHCKANGKTVYGLGAPVKGNTLLNTLNIDKTFISALVEKNPLRQGLYSPGQHIPILLEEEIKSHPDVYFVLAWNFKREILKNHAPLIKKGVEFFFPIQPTS